MKSLSWSTSDKQLQEEKQLQHSSQATFARSEGGIRQVWGASFCLQFADALKVLAGANGGETRQSRGIGANRAFLYSFIWP